jgi:hypothetical protein
VCVTGSLSIDRHELEVVVLAGNAANVRPVTHARPLRSPRCAPTMQNHLACAAHAIPGVCLGIHPLYGVNARVAACGL